MSAQVIGGGGGSNLDIKGDSELIKSWNLTLQNELKSGKYWCSFIPSATSLEDFKAQNDLQKDTLLDALTKYSYLYFESAMGCEDYMYSGSYYNIEAFANHTKALYDCKRILEVIKRFENAFKTQTLLGSGIVPASGTYLITPDMYGAGGSGMSVSSTNDKNPYDSFNIYSLSNKYPITGYYVRSHSKDSRTDRRIDNIYCRFNKTDDLTDGTLPNDSDRAYIIWPFLSITLSANSYDLTFIPSGPIKSDTKEYRVRGNYTNAFNVAQKYSEFKLYGIK